MWSTTYDPGVFDHVTIRATSRPTAEEFYTLVLRMLGIEPSYQDDDFVEWDDFSLLAESTARPATGGLHIGFVAPSRAAVDRFWAAGREAGHDDAGEPGERPWYTPGYYGAFLLDPDGNSVEAVHHDSLRRGGVIDHLWLRTADLDAARRFWETVARPAGLTVLARGPERFLVAGPSGSFSVVPGRPTRGLHLAFPAASDEVVSEFHRVVVAAGYRDDGPPGERPEYHAGYFGAFVLDPEGNSVELVNHNRPGGAG